MQKMIFISLVSIIGVLMVAKPICGDDWQYWSLYTVGGSVTDKLNWTFYPEFRFRDDMSEHCYSHYDIGLGYNWKDWIDLGINYRYIDSKGTDEWVYEHVPHGNIILKWKLNNFKLSNRCRLEYRIIEDATDSWRYRNKVTLKLPLEFTRFHISPFIADEFFVDFNEGELNLNRASIGVSAKFTEYVNGSVFYLLQSAKSDGDWSNVNVLGTKLSIRF